MAAKQYRLIAQAAQIRVGKSRVVTRYFGDVIDSDIAEESLKNLVELGFVEEIKGGSPAEAEADPDADPKGYSDWKVADLKAEIERRNGDRDEAEQIPSDGKKAELVEALEADDEQVAE